MAFSEQTTAYLIAHVPQPVSYLTRDLLAVTRDLGVSVCLIDCIVCVFCCSFVYSYFNFWFAFTRGVGFFLFLEFFGGLIESVMMTQRGQ
jgi:hypothetical protein